MRIDAARAGIDRLALEPVERGLPPDEPDRGGRPGRLDLRRADGLPEAVGAAGGQSARAARARARSPAPPARSPAAMPTRLAAALDGIDLAYVDPPYNQHSYLGNYHVWETLALRRPARALRRGLQARRLPHPQERLQLPPGGLDGARGPARARLHAVDRRLGLGRGLPRSRRRRREAGRARATWAPWRSTSSATWAPRSASTTRPASGSGGCRTCATPNGCFVCGPDRAALRRAIESAPAPAVPRRAEFRAGREPARRAAGLILIDTGGSSDERDAASGMDGGGDCGALGTGGGRGGLRRRLGFGRLVGERWRRRRAACQKAAVHAGAGAALGRSRTAATGRRRARRRRRHGCGGHDHPARRSARP